MSLCFVSFAQMGLSKKQLNDLTLDQRRLYERVKSADSLRTERIINFFLSNPSKSKVIRENSVSYVVYDILDGEPIYRCLDNSSAAIATGTNHLQVGGSLGLDLDGSGITVGVWDGGPIQLNHVEFQNLSGTSSRAVNLENLNTDGDPEQDNHATHVTGTIVAKGVNPSAKGMATNANVRTYNFNNDTLEMVVALADTNNPMFLSNHSYGVPISFTGGQTPSWVMGAYTGGAREIDDIVNTNPQYLIVTSAGNEGNTSYTGGLFSGFDKLTQDKNAKNNLVVANAAPTINAFTNQMTSFQINSSSSQGPTDDLRIKPEIAGDGTGLFSTIPGDGYATLTGTSMSSPNVTGSLVLLQDYYNQLHGTYMMASTLKGLACHAARDDSSRIGPDPVFGWGLLDSKKAAEVIMDDDIGLAVIEELSLVNGNSYEFNFAAESGDKLIASICWSDVPGVVTASSTNINDSSPKLVNDLDLRVIKDGVEFLPWKLNYDPVSGFSNSKGDNAVDNIERVEIDFPESGIYTIQVSHKGILQSSGAFGPLVQDFSLIVTGNNLTLSSEDISLNDTLTVFPNPSKGEFTFSFNSTGKNDVMIDIYDLSGRSVYRDIFVSTTRQFKQTIDLTNLQSGVYLVNILDGDRKTTKKIIIK